MRATLLALLFALTAASAVQALEPIPPYIEAWCDGGIDGRYQHATVEPDGTIRAARTWTAEKPWPVVAEEPEAAKRWFETLETTKPAGPPGIEDITVSDGIECGLTLNKGQEAVRYDLPEILHEIVVYVPNYH